MRLWPDRNRGHRAGGYSRQWSDWVHSVQGTIGPFRNDVLKRGGIYGRDVDQSAFALPFFESPSCVVSVVFLVFAVS